MRKGSENTSPLGKRKIQLFDCQKSSSLKSLITTISSKKNTKIFNTSASTKKNNFSSILQEKCETFRNIYKITSVEEDLKKLENITAKNSNARFD